MACFYKVLICCKIIALSEMPGSSNYSSHFTLSKLPRLNFCNFDRYLPAAARTQINNVRTITQRGVQELEKRMQKILISLSFQWREGRQGQTQSGLLSQGPHG